MTDADPASKQVRLSDADRERAAQRLHRALGEGRITLVELDERIGQVYAAQYPADLRPPLADLPGDPLIGSATATVSAASTEPLVLSTSSGHLKREGRWVLPPELQVEVGSGRVILDCTQAEIVSAEVTITVTVRSGLVLLLLPRAATANIDGVRTRTGSARTKVAAVPVPGVLHLVVRGTVGSGRVVVREPRKKLFGHGDGIRASEV